MQRWQQSSKGSTQLSAKLPEASKEDFREVCEEQGETMTNVIVDLMAKTVEERKGTRDADNMLPNDERLLKAWRVLRHNAAPDTNIIPLKSAESLLANELNVPKQIILQTWLMFEVPCSGFVLRNIVFSYCHLLTTMRWFANYPGTVDKNLTLVQ